MCCMYRCLIVTGDSKADLAFYSSVMLQVVVMDNGCMCCTVRGDLLGAFSAVMEKMVDSGNALDAVIVETTGMADPVPIVRTFLQVCSRSRSHTQRYRHIHRQR